MRPRRLPTWREGILSDVFAAWVVVGLFVDGWAHNHQKPETVLTPWHGIMYSGFMVCAWWAVKVARRDQRPGESMWYSAPIGHALVLVGTIVFAFGATTDLAWHSLLGVEVSLAALLSPTHLLMLAGALLVMTGPFRAAWADGRQQSPSLREFLPALGSIILATSLVAFFFQYASPFRLDNFGTWVSGYTSLVTRFPGAAASYQRSLQIEGLLGLLVTNVIYIGALLLVLRRWRPPFGTTTVLFCAVTTLVVGIDGFHRPAPVLAALLAGLVGDVLIRWHNRSAHPKATVYAVAAATSLVLWGSFFVVYALAYGVGWKPELWAGALVMAALSATGMSVLAFPPALPAALSDRPSQS